MVRRAEAAWSGAVRRGASRDKLGEVLNDGEGASQGKSMLT